MAHNTNMESNHIIALLSSSRGEMRASASSYASSTHRSSAQYYASRQWHDRNDLSRKKSRSLTKTPRKKANEIEKRLKCKPPSLQLQIHEKNPIPQPFPFPRPSSNHPALQHTNSPSPPFPSKSHSQNTNLRLALQTKSPLIPAPRKAS